MGKACFILIIAVFASAVFGVQDRQSFLGLGQKPVCVYDGDYCKDNTDCCSTNCVANKCMISTAMAINTNEVNSPIPEKDEPQKTSTLDNKFNDETPRICQANGARCSSTLKCCSFLTCENNVCLDRSVYINGTETLGYNKNSTELDNRFNENDEALTPTPVSGKCVELGEKCFKPSECCTPLKCHSFLHQCVT